MTGSQTLEIVFLPFNNLSSLLKKEIIVKEELISRVWDLKSKKVNTFYSVHFTLYTVNKNSYVHMYTISNHCHMVTFSVYI